MNVPSVAKTSMALAESYLNRANNKREEAENHLKSFRYPESISASQECTELSLKAVFLLLDSKHPRTHDLKEEQFEPLLERIPEKLKYLQFPKLYLHSRFWSEFYTIAKYGLEKLAIGPEKLFGKEEAELALKHAQDSRFTAGVLESYVKHPW